MERLYELYAIHMDGDPDPKSARFLETGTRLARYQKLFNSELAVLRLRTGREGGQVSLATHVPTTSPDFLRLILREERRKADAAEELVSVQRGIVSSPLCRTGSAC